MTRYLLLAAVALALFTAGAWWLMTKGIQP